MLKFWDINLLFDATMVLEILPEQRNTLPKVQQLLSTSEWLEQEGVRKYTYSPQKHHQPRQAIGLLLLPIVPYLGYQLYTPEDSANRTEDISGDGNACLGCHVLEICYRMKIL